MSQDEIRRVHDAIAECNRYIAREMTYSPHLRNMAMIHSYEKHLSKLFKMLEAA